MTVFLKAIACILIALIIWICIGKQSKEFSVLLTLSVCAMVFIASLSFMQPILQFVDKIQQTGSLDEDLVSIIIKSVGIGIVSEICVLVCKDAGNESLGKALQFLTTTVVLWISIPVFEKILTLIDNILGTV